MIIVDDFLGVVNIYKKGALGSIFRGTAVALLWTLYFLLFSGVTVGGTYLIFGLLNNKLNESTLITIIFIYAIISIFIMFSILVIGVKLNEKRRNKNAVHIRIITEDGFNVSIINMNKGSIVYTDIKQLNAEYYEYNDGFKIQINTVNYCGSDNYKMVITSLNSDKEYEKLFNTFKQFGIKTAKVVDTD